MNDSIWQGLRYILIAGGSWLAARGKLNPTEVEPLADATLQVAGGAVAVIAAAWGLYVRFGTASVPKAQADRAPQVEELSAATGKPKEKV